MFSSSTALESDPFVGKRACCLACFLLKVMGLVDSSA